MLCSVERRVLLGGCQRPQLVAGSKREIRRAFGDVRPALDSGLPRQFLRAESLLSREDVDNRQGDGERKERPIQKRCARLARLPGIDLIWTLCVSRTQARQKLLLARVWHRSQSIGAGRSW